MTQRVEEIVGRLSGEWVCESRIRPLVKALLDAQEALLVAEEALDGYSDVRDGDYGDPMPNRAMSALREIREGLEKVQGVLSSRRGMGKGDG